MSKECPFCQNQSYKIYQEELCSSYFNNTTIDINIYKCLTCNLIFDCTNLDFDIRKFIKDDYYKLKSYNSIINKRYIKHFTRRSENHLKIINKFAKKKGNVLDVGCGAGIFLNHMKNNGWNCFGIEPDVGCYNYSKNILNLNVENCLFEDYSAKNNFDLIYLSHIFDDLPNIKLTINKISNLMNIGGLLFIEVPNHKRDLKFKKVRIEDFIENKYYFTTESIKHIFKNSSLKICYLNTYESCYLNNLSQYLTAPYQILKKIILPKNKKEQIRLIAKKSS